MGNKLQCRIIFERAISGESGRRAPQIPDQDPGKRCGTHFYRWHVERGQPWGERQYWEACGRRWHQCVVSERGGEWKPNDRGNEAHLQFLTFWCFLNFWQFESVKFWCVKDLKFWNLEVCTFDIFKFENENNEFVLMVFKFSNFQNVNLPNFKFSNFQMLNFFCGTNIQAGVQTLKVWTFERFKFENKSNAFVLIVFKLSNFQILKVWSLKVRRPSTWILCFRSQLFKLPEFESLKVWRQSTQLICFWHSNFKLSNVQTFKLSNFQIPVVLNVWKFDAWKQKQIIPVDGLQSQTSNFQTLKLSKFESLQAWSLKANTKSSCWRSSHFKFQTFKISSSRSLKVWKFESTKKEFVLTVFNLSIQTLWNSRILKLWKLGKFDSETNNSCWRSSSFQTSSFQSFKLSKFVSLTVWSLKATTTNSCWRSSNFQNKTFKFSNPRSLKVL